MLKTSYLCLGIGKGGIRGLVFLDKNKSMKANNNNVLRRGALFSLFITSYIPLFAIVIGKQITEGWIFLNWGGWNKEAIWCLLSHFGMSILLAFFSLIGIIGLLVLLKNLNNNLSNGDTVKVTKISNRNSEAIGYIATYIVPFMASNFTSWFECVVFVVVMGLIYVIYTNSNMILINPLLSIWYSLLEVEYKALGNSQGDTHDALIITDTKDYKENVNYKIYQIGFKLYYGNERQGNKRAFKTG